jgi:hypothetical protein
VSPFHPKGTTSPFASNFRVIFADFSVKFSKFYCKLLDSDKQMLHLSRAKRVYRKFATGGYGTMATAKKSKATLSTLRPRDAELVAVGVEAAALLRRVRELESHSLNYFFEMAWHSVYQEADEVTRVALMEAVEADLSRELARMRKAS